MAKHNTDPEQELWDKQYPTLAGANAESRKAWLELWADEEQEKQYRQDCHDAGQEIVILPAWIYKGRSVK